MPKFYDPQLNFINSVSQDVFRKKEIEQELCDLECKRKDLIKQVADVKLEHCDLLKKCAEMKFNSYQKNSAELIQINAKIDQVKAGYAFSIIFAFFLNGILIFHFILFQYYSKLNRKQYYWYHNACF